MATKQFSSVVVIVAALSLAACGNDGPTDPNGSSSVSGEFSAVIPVGGELEIIGISGSVVAGPATSNEAVVRWTKTGNPSDINRVVVEVDERQDGTTIRAVYPTGNVDVEVQFTAEVPAGVDLEAVMVSGNVEALELESEVRATSVSGNVTITTTETAEADVVSGSISITTDRIAQANVISGSITAIVRSAVWEDDMNFSAISGDISVEIPANSNGFVSLTTESGILSSEFFLTGTALFLEGILGTGGRTLSASTLSGAVSLLAGPDA